MKPKTRSHNAHLRYARPLARLVAACVMMAACDRLVEPIVPVEQTTGDLIFQLGSGCPGRLSGPVQFYVNDVYRGQSTNRLTVSGMTLGIHKFEAFTANRGVQWGPREFEIQGFPHTRTLDC